MASAERPSADGAWAQQEAARIASLARILQLRQGERGPTNDPVLREEYGRLLEVSALLIRAAVSHVLSRFTTTSLSAEDLFQEGAARILKVAHRYDPERGKASAFLFLCVRTACKQAVVECLGAVKVSTSTVKHARCEFRKRHGRSAQDMQELVDAGLLTEKQVQDVRRAQGTRTGSVHTGAGRAEGFRDDPLAAIADSRHAAPSVVAERVDGVRNVVRAIEAVAARNPRAGDVLRARLGIAADGTLTGETRTFEEIAAEQGVSRQAVRQLYERAHGRVIARIRETPTDDMSAPDCCP